MFNSLRVAVSFITTLPFPAADENQPVQFGKAAGWFSLIGACIGALLSVLGMGLSLVLPPLVAGVLLTGVWVALTGGLHLDGLADCCDGLLVSADRERRLEIMKDSRLGAFGGMGLALALILKAALITELLQGALWGPLMLAASLGRWFILLAAQQPKARPGGLGETFSRGIDRKSIFISALVPLMLVVWQGAAAWVALGVAVLVLSALLFAVRRRLGGVTGDVFGLVVEVTELVVLLIFSMKCWG